MASTMKRDLNGVFSTPKQATLVGPKGERVSVEVDSPQAKTYFSKGYTLENKPQVDPATVQGQGSSPILPQGSVDTTQDNPMMASYNSLMMDSLKKAQGVDTTELLKRQRDLQRQAISARTADAPAGFETMSPSQQNQIRNSNAGVIEKELDDNAYQLARAEKAINNFEDVFYKAQQFGQEFADKMVLPESMINNYKLAIEADPENMTTLLATLNDKSKQAVINELDYTKLKKPVESKAPEIQKIVDADGNERSVYWDGTKMVDASTLISSAPTPETPGSKTNEDFNTWKNTFKGTITQGFDTPVDYFADGRTTHSGYDIAGKLGEAITSPVSGTIISETKESDGSGWGNSILLQDEQGNKWRMGHFQDLAVKVGDKVSAGSQAIGYLGNTGTVMKGDGTKPNAQELAAGRGTHLHIEAKDSQGNFIDVGKIPGSEEKGKYDVSKFTPKFYNSDLGQKVLNNEQQYLTNFQSQQLVKDYLVVQNKSESVKKIVELGVGGPGDLALVFDFMKSLDPNSVVRETEYDTAAKSGNIFAGWAAKFNGYLKEEGGFLPDNVKDAFMQITAQKLDVSQQQYNTLRDQYRQIAFEQNLNPNHVAPDMNITWDTSSKAKTIIYQGKKYSVDSNGDMTEIK